MFSRGLFAQTKSVLSHRSVVSRAMAPVAVHVQQCFNNFSLQQQNCTNAMSFHTSAFVEAKAAKKGGSKKGGDDEDGAALPEISITKKNMDMVVDRFSVEVGKLKVGKASADVFRDIQVGSYGSVSSAGQVTVKNASTVTIAVYEPSMVKTVADAIKDCGLGFSPTIENSVVSVFIPKPSKESRDALVKSASQLGEKVSSFSLNYHKFPHSFTKNRVL